MKYQSLTMFIDCNADGCLKLSTVQVCKASYCLQHAKEQLHIRSKIQKYKDSDLSKELKWRMKENDLRSDRDEAHVRRIEYLLTILNLRG